MAEGKRRKTARRRIKKRRKEKRRGELRRKEKRRGELRREGRRNVEKLSYERNMRLQQNVVEKENM